MNDKVKHILAGLLIASVVGIPCYVNTYDLFAGLWGCTAGIIAGGVKEYFDLCTDGNKWDWWDFAATCIGAVLVALFIIGLHFGKG
jgi:hypothetical protein